MTAHKNVKKYADYFLISNTDFRTNAKIQIFFFFPLAGIFSPANGRRDGCGSSGMSPPPSDVTRGAAQWTRRPVRARPASGVQGSVPVLASGERRCCV
ncbi:hypothetical protein CEXT_540121 [Caerostris extrusa]|uniref:Uncharacterized protein n=1 Tax=Caerostris extrusa TaxID=172846 RepID=A0AAV4T5R6_CAEEX|nr:hypothetical protein CEXT_540121 [Caerostris extrusa]